MLCCRSLAGKPLGGTLPNDFNLWGNLNHLQTLDVANSGLSGELPVALSQTGSLQQIIASGNGFTGGLPSWVRLPNLNTIAVDNNKLTGGHSCLLHL